MSDPVIDPEIHITEEGYQSVGGWLILQHPDEPRSISLVTEEDSSLICYDDNPLIAPQLRALAKILIQTAEKLERMDNPEPKSDLTDEDFDTHPVSCTCIFCIPGA